MMNKVTECIKRKNLTAAATTPTPMTPMAAMTPAQQEALHREKKLLIQRQLEETKKIEQQRTQSLIQSNPAPAKVPIMGTPTALGKRPVPISAVTPSSKRSPSGAMNTASPTLARHTEQ